MLLPSLQPLISLLLGAPPSQSEFSFRAPAAPKDIARIPSLTGSYPVEPIEPSSRKGCVIGWEHPSSLPSKTEPLELGALGEHFYGGAQGPHLVSMDSIGHIYTRYGGIIDIAHVRDHADLTQYIARHVVKKFNRGGEIHLGDDTDIFRPDTGKRVIKLKAQGKEPSAYQAAVLGGVISYEVSIWHEISTYKNWQDYSCFSPEDNYSNLLGAYLGFLACLTEGVEYNNAMTVALHRTLLTLGPQPLSVTRQAVEYVEGHWYHYGEWSDYDDAGPDPDVRLYLDRRHIATGYNQSRADNITPSYVVSPWLVTDARRRLPEELRTALITDRPTDFRTSIRIPQKDENKKPLRDFYSFEIKNPTNADNSIFDHPDMRNGVNSTNFGVIVEQIREKLLSTHRNADEPQ